MTALIHSVVDHCGQFREFFIDQPIDMRCSRLAAVLAVFLSATTLVSAPLEGQQVVDQSQLLVQAGFPFESKWIGQSFQTSAANVSGAGLMLRNIAGNPSLPIESSTLTINLWTALPSQTGAMRLATGSALVSGVYYGDLFWADVFWSPVSVTTGTTYWITAGLSNPIFQATMKGDDSYPYGFAAHSDHFHAAPTESSSYELATSQDLVFRTYTTVPEPNTLWLVGAGLVGVGIMRRRRLNKETAEA